MASSKHLGSWENTRLALETTRLRLVVSRVFRWGYVTRKRVISTKLFVAGISALWMIFVDGFFFVHACELGLSSKTVSDISYWTFCCQGWISGKSACVYGHQQHRSASQKTIPSQLESWRREVRRTSHDIRVFQVNQYWTNIPHYYKFHHVTNIGPIWISHKFVWRITPFTPKSDQCQISPAASPEILHHTVWRTWLKDDYLPILTTPPIGWENS